VEAWNKLKGSQAEIRRLLRVATGRQLSKKEMADASTDTSLVAKGMESINGEQTKVYFRGGNGYFVYINDFVASPKLEERIRGVGYRLAKRETKEYSTEGLLKLKRIEKLIPTQPKGDRTLTVAYHYPGSFFYYKEKY